MLAVYDPPRLTSLTFEQAARAMRQALQSLDVARVRNDTLALALAKTALETGRWRLMYNWNWGNVKASETFRGMYTAYHCNEVINGKVVWLSPEGVLDRKGGQVVGPVKYPVPPGHPWSRFRAFANEYDGAYEYVNFVATGRYVDAWQELLQGDAAAYVHALKLKGYFTADEATYAKGVISMQREFMTRLVGSEPETTYEPPDADWEHFRSVAKTQLFEGVQIIVKDERDANLAEEKPTSPLPRQS